MELAKKLKQYRRNLKITQEGMAEALNLSVSYICDLEKGRSAPRLQTLAAIAQYFGVSTGQLLADTEYAGDTHEAIPPALRELLDNPELGPYIDPAAVDLLKQLNFCGARPMTMQDYLRAWYALAVETWGK